MLRRVVRHRAQGKKPYLNRLQQRALVAKVQQGQFRTVWDVIQWVRGRWGVSYTYKGMYSRFREDWGIQVIEALRQVIEIDPDPNAG